MVNPTQKHCLLNILILMIICFNSATASKKDAPKAAATYNVVQLGAKPDGRTDSAKAFLSAWTKACASKKPAEIHVPQGQFKFASGVIFKGPCANNAIAITIDGKLLAPSEHKGNGKADHWLLFENVNGVSINGGTLDGHGAAFWDCKRSHKGNCPVGATSLKFEKSKNIGISRLTSTNSQMFHMGFNGCDTVKIEGVKIVADGQSPNTDGIHVQMSSNFKILKSKISTGDDCVSIGPGSSNLLIENIECGPGHGISIGSLGWTQKEPGVQKVTVKSVRFIGTQNGVRIKSWAKPSNGFVKEVLFQNATMVNVQNPIIIDQNYCPSKQNCPHQASGVKISDIRYEDIHGTSATEVAVKFDCSSSHPCSDIKVENVKLTYQNHDAKASCNHVGITNKKSVKSQSCL